MNNKILKSTDENINMNFFMCFCLGIHNISSSVSASVGLGCLKEEKFMDQFYGTKTYMKYFYEVFLSSCVLLSFYDGDGCDGRLFGLLREWFKFKWGDLRENLEVW
jgi:hypothetical protein